MKIFVWEEVLTDYTPGLAVGYGEAMEEVLKEFPEHMADQLGRPSMVIDCECDKSPFGVYVYGGG